MLNCPGCGTPYLTLQPNCQNCGAPSDAKVERTLADPGEELPLPPPASRQVPNLYSLRLLSSDPWSIAALIFGLVGFVFTAVVAVPAFIAVFTFDAEEIGTLNIEGTLVMIIILIVGLVSLAAGSVLIWWRYREARKVVKVIREGEPAQAQIVELERNHSVRINGRHPWIIGYEFEVNGLTYKGKLSILNEPGREIKVGKAVRILYLAADPKWNSLYPRP